MNEDTGQASSTGASNVLRTLDVIAKLAQIVLALSGLVALAAWAQYRNLPTVAVLNQKVSEQQVRVDAQRQEIDRIAALLQGTEKALAQWQQGLGASMQKVMRYGEESAAARDQAQGHAKNAKERADAAEQSAIDAASFLAKLRTAGEHDVTEKGKNKAFFIMTYVKESPTLKPTLTKLGFDEARIYSAYNNDDADEPAVVIYHARSVEAHALCIRRVIAHCCTLAGTDTVGKTISLEIDMADTGNASEIEVRIPAKVECASRKCGNLDVKNFCSAEKLYGS